MQKNGLTSSQKKEGRRWYNLFQAINSLSFALTNGSIITLYALKTGADSAFVGLIASFNYLSYMLAPVGKMLEPKMGAVKVYGWGWLGRNFCMLPMLFIPLLLKGNLQTWAFAAILVASIGFNIARGIALIGNNPTAAMLADGKDRSRYLSLLLMINYAGTIGVTLFLAFMLRLSDSFASYTLLLFIGIATGVWASALLFKLPDAPRIEKGGSSVFSAAMEAFKRPSFRIFAIAYFLISFVMASVRPFLVVYTKEVYGQTDSMSIFFTALGAAGAFVMSAFSKMIINAVGTKTLFIFFLLMSALSLLPALASPELAGAALIIFLCAFQFIATFGMQGVESNAQAYFFTVIRQDEILSLSVLYYMLYGLGGGLGSVLGGFVLNAFAHAGFEPRASYQIFFILAFCAFGVLLLLMAQLKNTGKHSVLDGLGYIFNYRDIKAISLANRLTDTSLEKQEKLLKEISRSESDAPVDLLIESLSSPKMRLRRAALYALEGLPPTRDPDLAMALINQVKTYPHTTAYMAVRILGRNKTRRALAIVKQAFESQDLNLKAEGIRALGELNDQRSLKSIESLIKPDVNPYLVVQALNAMEKMLDSKEAHRLFKPLMWQKIDRQLVDEALLSAAAVLGAAEAFYPAYTVFLKNPDEGYAAAFDPLTVYKKELPANRKLFEALLSRPKPLVFAKEALAIIEKSAFEDPCAKEALARAVKNPLLTRHRRFRFFVFAQLVQVKVKRRQQKELAKNAPVAPPPLK